ncbi:unnamed protein product [Rotaria sordida]|uniref:UMOD/GP2/OIT3-like D8C domain-containing protein n=1 Tax=Rotaria sordida TaxID=392033 RepID=A0A815Q6J9_9BILA|nr:unnamed protein product [Rotaria sordida]CAF1458783.1 unnamed protein product [Rotaria sordida]CAF1514653.1 unnamed protein product [Rotaria sordida]CAF3633718.1 unnamed protein product [Rotaria sordida]CAF4120041.1 unnamed protein product [Rotaria sordida]
MSSNNELLPASTRVSYIQPQYLSDDRQMQQYQQMRQQPRKTDPFQSLPSVDVKNNSVQQRTIMMIVAGTLVGLVVCGVPLAVISSLYVQTKNNSNGTTNTASNTSTSSLPSQCSSYTINAESTRNTGYTTCCYCDNSLATGWYRFISPAGTQLATSPLSQSYCGTSYPGWFNGSFPTTVGGLTTGTVCVNYGGNLCYSTFSVTSILVTNCGDFYIFYLRAMPSCNSRYCTA